MSQDPPAPTFATLDAGDMRFGAPGLVGKTIAHVVVKKRPRRPLSQLFLVFTDGKPVGISRRAAGRGSHTR
jgi:hypothetical protein